MEVKKKTNFRVVVEPKQYYSQAEEYIMKDCQNIEEQIKRHVDDVDSVQIKYDIESRCSFCNRDWELLDDGQPSCCQEAIEIWEANNG